jgi:hypothetical protein
MFGCVWKDIIAKQGVTWLKCFGMRCIILLLDKKLIGVSIIFFSKPVQYWNFEMLCLLSCSFVLSLADVDPNLMMEDESMVWTSNDVVIVLEHQNEKIPLRWVNMIYGYPVHMSWRLMHIIVTVDISTCRW